jgi:hypothetical protein
MNAIEKAAFEYERENRGGILSGVDIINAFEDGAKWQKQQMMKEAVECELVCIKDRLAAILPMKEFRWTVGDKVRIIIVKEEGE